MKLEQDKNSTNTNLDIPNTNLNSPTISDISSSVIIKTNLIYGNRKTAYKSVIREYSKKTSVHGLKYIFEIHRPFYEKLFWLIFLLISLFFAGKYTWKTYVKWLDSPTVLGFDETLVKIHKIPFPTVTICPENKRDAFKFDFSYVSNMFWSEMENLNEFHNETSYFREHYLEKFLTTLQTCDLEVINKFYPYVPKNLTVDIVQNLLNIASGTYNIIRWKGIVYYDCLKRVLTDEGVCYQFNGLQHQDIYKNPDYMSYKNDESYCYLNKKRNLSFDEYYQSQGFSTYLERSTLSSARYGFRVLLDSDTDDNDYECTRFKQGFKLFINSPDSIPLTMGNYILVPYSHEVMVTLSPQYITSQKQLWNIEPEKRQCYFNNERNLYFFKIYTQTNCQAECLTNYTIAKCGCVKFWMPKPLDIPICDLSKVTCYTNATNELEVLIANQTAQKAKDPTVKILCDCMPACNSLEYNFEINRAYFDTDALVKAIRGDRYKKTRISRLNIHFRETQFTAIKRTVLYDLTQLIANCGGIFALFMGVSMLSLIELIYFFSVRLVNNFRKRRQIQKKIKQLEILNIN
ncbi:pickpocket protein 28-like [Lucilia sericata]|uniref:pickpocket protein 28-like n=1 Tax=Lucilia sericata TaxID=13632 RepID=UPI0018A823B1|nr:pickpocket protein 28-like [Lucilia sericata]